MPITMNESCGGGEISDGMRKQNREYSQLRNIQSKINKSVRKLEVPATKNSQLDVVREDLIEAGLEIDIIIKYL